MGMYDHVWMVGNLCEISEQMRRMRNEQMDI